MWEKDEFILSYNVGEVSEGEMQAANSLSEEESSSTNFTCGSHFYEEVEDTKVCFHGTEWGLR